MNTQNQLLMIAEQELERMMADLSLNIETQQQEHLLRTLDGPVEESIEYKAHPHEDVSSLQNLKIQINGNQDLLHNITSLTQGFVGFMEKVHALKEFCQSYLDSLKCQLSKQKFLKQSQSIQQENAKESADDAQVKASTLNSLIFKSSGNRAHLNERQTQEFDYMPYLIRPSKRFEPSSESLQKCLNKLKVLILKVKIKESSSFEYVHETYISRLKDSLNESTLQQKAYNIYRNKKIIMELRKRFNIITRTSLLKLFRNSQLLNSNVNDALFYVNFSCERLMFRGNCRINSPRKSFNIQNFLFCPIVLKKGRDFTSVPFSKDCFVDSSACQNKIRVCRHYLARIAEVFPRWKASRIMVKVIHRPTDHTKPIFYSYFKPKELVLPIELRNDDDFIVHRENQENFKFNFDFQNEEEVFGCLQKVESFIYQKLVFDYLSELLDSSNRSFSLQTENQNFSPKTTVSEVILEMDNNIELRLEWNEQLNPELFEGAGGEKQCASKYLPSLALEIFLILKDPQIQKLTKIEMTERFRTKLKFILLKTFLEETGHRALTSQYAGSMGSYFYQYRSSKKNSTKKFFESFSGEQFEFQKE